MPYLNVLCRFNSGVLLEGGFHDTNCHRDVVSIHIHDLCVEHPRFASHPNTPSQRCGIKTKHSMHTYTGGHPAVNVHLDAIRGSCLGGGDRCEHDHAVHVSSNARRVCWNFVVRVHLHKHLRVEGMSNQGRWHAADIVAEISRSKHRLRLGSNVANLRVVVEFAHSLGVIRVECVPLLTNPLVPPKLGHLIDWGVDLHFRDTRDAQPSWNFALLRPHQTA